MENEYEPAYPKLDSSFEDITNGGTTYISEGGLTKRERFAMAAMQGILSNPNTNIGDSEWPTWLERTSRRIADAHLKELEE